MYLVVGRWGRGKKCVYETRRESSGFWSGGAPSKRYSMQVKCRIACDGRLEPLPVACSGHALLLTFRDRQVGVPIGQRLVSQSDTVFTRPNCQLCVSRFVIRQFFPSMPRPVRATLQFPRSNGQESTDTLPAGSGAEWQWNCLVELGCFQWASLLAQTSSPLPDPKIAVAMRSSDKALVTSSLRVLNTGSDEFSITLDPLVHPLTVSIKTLS